MRFSPPVGVSMQASLYKGEAVKPNLAGRLRLITKWPKSRARLATPQGRNRLRPQLIALLLFAPSLAGLGCASQDPATRAAEHAAAESEDDATCRQKAPEDGKAYDECRKGAAEAKARQSALQEQKRRDFDRVLGAGTDGQDNY